MAALLLASVWCSLLLGAALATGLGADRAMLAAYTACAALLLATRPRGQGSTPALATALAGVAGFVALPAWIASVWWIGQGVGLEAEPPRAAPGGSVASALAHVALAPVFEELLYRERVLPALRARLGSPLALVLSSALFAAPHLEPWSLLATFGVGLALGGVFLATGRAELCVAHHAGLNAAVLVAGLPPVRLALAPPLAAFAGAALLGLACRWTRGRAARPRGHGGPPEPHARGVREA